MPDSPERPPTFNEYLGMKYGELSLMDCTAERREIVHLNVHCRPDETCWRHGEPGSSSDDSYCVRRTNVNVYLPGFRKILADLQYRPPGGGAEGTGPGVDIAPQPDADVSEEPRDQAEEPMPQGGEGGAGSLSQMMVHDSTLFVLTAQPRRDQGWLTSFDIADERNPELLQIMELDNGPEALQVHDNLLLIAGRHALVTATVATDDGPRLLGERREPCRVDYDPVVVEDSIAYRTVIAEGPRNRCTSRLEVIDVSEPHQSEVVATERIERPRGLAVLDERLFVADEPNGVQVYDVSDPDSPSRVDTWELSGVHDLVLSDFDLYAMTSDEVQVFYVAPLFGDGALSEIVSQIRGHRAVERQR